VTGHDSGMTVKSKDWKHVFQIGGHIFTKYIFSEPQIYFSNHTEIMESQLKQQPTEYFKRGEDMNKISNRLHSAGNTYLQYCKAIQTIQSQKCTSTLHTIQSKLYAVSIYFSAPTHSNRGF
jgi:c-di-GMP-related signal transduction protein